MLCLIVVTLSLAGVRCELINSEVARIVNLESHLLKTSIYLTLGNFNTNAPEESYLYPTKNDANIAYISFKNVHGNELSYVKTNFRNGNGEIEPAYRVMIKDELVVNQTVQLKVELVELNAIRPLYKTRQFDQELMLVYSGNYYFYSCYETYTLHTHYILSNGSRELEMSCTPVSRVNQSLQYYVKNVKPFSFEEIEIKFKKEMDFLVVTNLERIIDVSHFGAICVEDRVDVTNQAGKLVGPFKLRALKDVVKWWNTFLPSSAVDIKYYDLLGYNLKIHASNFVNYTTLKLQPRYPLLSGWKTSYILQYCLPVYEYLYHDYKNNYILRMRAIDDVLENFVAQDVLVKVLLPEQSEVINVKLPVGFSERQKEKTYTSLVFYGRPTIVLNGSNIVENHINDFEVAYKFVKYSNYTSGIIICTYLYIIFLFIIIIMHITTN